MLGFTIELPAYEIEDGVTVDLTISGDSRYVPPCCVGELGTIDVDVREVVNAKGCPLPPSTTRRLKSEDRFRRAVLDALLDGRQG